MEKHDKAIARYSASVILRIILFILVYICLIILGGILIWLAFKLAIAGFPHIIEIRNLYGMFFAAMALLGVIGFALMFGLYLFKFLFSRTTSEGNNRREITESECPQLYQTIREVAQATGSPMPKKVFLSPDVNACVFYNTGFWSIFFPVRKNLEVGLGLFTALNIDELKGILAHEFGHFSQKSMKVGSGVYITNTVLHDLAFQEDKWDQWLDEWCMVNVWVLSFFGVLTRRFTNLVRVLLQRMYGMVNRSFFELSRQMEYDADAVACKCTGKDVFISGLCKIEFTSYSLQYSASFVSDMAGRQKKIDNIFRVHSMMTDFLAVKHGITLNPGVLLEEPIESKISYSNISMQNSWESHPSLANRISHVQGLVVNKDVDLRPAWELIPVNIVQEVSAKVLSIMAEDIAAMETVTDRELSECCEAYYKSYSIPAPYNIYLDRDITLFNKAEAAGKETVNPFTVENTRLMKELEAAIEDLNTMYDILNGNIEAEYILYKEVRYTSKNLPVEEHKEYVSALQGKAVIVDMDVYNYTMSRTGDEAMKKQIDLMYDVLFMIQKIRENYEYDTTLQINTIINIFRAARQRTEGEIIEIKKYVFSTEDNVKNMIKETPWELIESVLQEDAQTTITELKEYGYSTSYKHMEADFDVKAIDAFMQKQSTYFETLRKCNLVAKVKLAGIMEEIC